MLKNLNVFLVVTIILSSVSFAAERFRTRFDEEGERHESFYLDRHHIRCPESRVLSQFQLKREIQGDKATGLFGYKFQCSSGLKVSPINAKITDWNDAGNGDVRYLERHNIECDAHEALTNFGLVRELSQKETTGRIAFEYGCTNVQLENVVEYETELNEEGAGETAYLDRHNVSCPGDTVLNAFRLVRDADQSKYKYVYKCGRIAAEPRLKFHPLSADCKALLKVIQEDECFKDNGWFCDYRFMRYFNALYEPGAWKLPLDENGGGYRKDLLMPYSTLVYYEPSENAASRRDKALLSCKFEHDGNLFSAADYVQSVLKNDGLANVLRRETTLAQARSAKK